MNAIDIKPAVTVSYTHLLCANVNVDDNMKLKAVSENVNLLRTDRAIFDTALEVYKKSND